MVTKSKNQEISISLRIMLFVFGVIGSIGLIVYSLNWHNVENGFTILGVDITQWTMAGMLVFMSIGLHSLLKSGIIGKWKMD